MTAIDAIGSALAKIACPRSTLRLCAAGSRPRGSLTSAPAQNALLPACKAGAWGRSAWRESNE
jgi:hypothetical protein